MKVKSVEEITKVISKNSNKIASFGVSRLGIFGSFVKGEQKKFSDVDVLVEFREGKKTYRNFISLAFFLEEILGREVELVTTESISPYLRPHILEEVEYVKVA